MKNEQVRKQILNSFLENLSGIADKEYQRRVWIRGEGPECDDFTDTVCDYFDLEEPIFEDTSAYALTERQKTLIIEFRQMFREFSNNHDFPEEFIDSPEWNEIVKMAKEVLKAFGYEEGKKFSL